MKQRKACLMSAGEIKHTEELCTEKYVMERLEKSGMKWEGRVDRIDEYCLQGWYMCIMRMEEGKGRA